MPKRILRWGQQAYLLVPKPRVLRVFFAWNYVGFIAYSIWIIIQPPMTFEGILGDTLTRGLASFIIVGALIGIPTALRGLWSFERVGLILMFGGILIYFGITIWLQASAGGNRAFPLMFSQTALNLIVLRFILTWGRYIEPGR